MRTSQVFAETVTNCSRVTPLMLLIGRLFHSGIALGKKNNDNTSGKGVDFEYWSMLPYHYGVFMVVSHC